MMKHMLGWVIFVLMMVMIGACGKDRDPSVESIQIDMTSLQQSYELGAFDLEGIQLIVTMSDGSTEILDIDVSMIDNEEMAMLDEPGTYDLVVTYQGVTTTLRVHMTYDELTLRLMAYYEAGVESGTVEVSYEDWLESIKGEDGISITNVYLNATGDLVVVYSDGREDIAGRIITPMAYMEHRVVFRFEERGPMYDYFYVSQTSIIEAPVEPVKAGFVFDGWYHNGLKVDFPFHFEDLESIEFEARWTRIPFTYIIKDGAVTITSYVGTNEDVVIPCEIDGYPVRRLGSQMFGTYAEKEAMMMFDDQGIVVDDIKIRTVRIPESVTSIGSFAFFMMNDLEQVIFEGISQLESIEAYAFAVLPRLTSFHIPESVTQIQKYGFILTGIMTFFAEINAEPEGWHESWKPNGVFVHWNSDPSEFKDITLVMNGIQEDRHYQWLAGAPLMLPEPYEEDFVFDGWYSDEALTVPFEATVMLDEDLTLYASWHEYQSLWIFHNKEQNHSALLMFANMWGEANGVDVQVSLAHPEQYYDYLMNALQSDRQPDMFMVDDYAVGEYFGMLENKMLDLSDQEWVSETDFEWVYDNQVIGFPVIIEGFGMIYNKDILDEAGVDPDTLININAYEAAFQAIEAANIDGLEHMVSLAAGEGMYWTTGMHNFNGYLSSGLAMDDRSVIDDLLNGVVNVDRLDALANWVELLINHSDPVLLTSWNYSDQVNAFKLGQTAFLHQGNWVDEVLIQGGLGFEVGIAPHASALGDADRLFASAFTYYAVNKDTDNTNYAKQFLGDLGLTPEGQQIMASSDSFVSPFINNPYAPTWPVGKAVHGWIQAEKTYAIWYNEMPSGFGMYELGPIYEQFAKGLITKTEFALAIKNEIELLGLD